MVALLGMKDLAQRWQYTRQGVHQKQRYDSCFPRPIARINNGRTQVFLQDEIVKYEQQHPELMNPSDKRRS